MKLAVIIPTFNSPHYINPLMGDIDEQIEGLDIIVVDNGGGYKQGLNEHVLRPKENLRWTKSNNLGLAYAKALEEWQGPYDGFVLLNDDIRLSRGFFDGLRAEALSQEDVGIVAPLYDDVHKNQKSEYSGEARAYLPTSYSMKEDTVDGTAILITKQAVDSVGLLDVANFGDYGWGGEWDYCYRVRQAGLKVIVTGRAFINHFHQGTAKNMGIDWNSAAANELNTGMETKYGHEWRSVIWGG